MLVIPPPTKRYGEMEVGGTLYYFQLKKNYKVYAQIELIDMITKKYVREIQVPKDISIGAPINTTKNETCVLLRSEIKPIHWYTKKVYSYKRR